MSRMIIAIGVVAFLLMAAATLRTDSAPGALQEGDPFPALEGHDLTGGDARLPQAALGRVAVVAIGFTYGSRFPVEAWADWYYTTITAGTAVVLFEVPMIGGVASLGRWFIDKGMRNGTPAELHDRVITVYGHAGEWKHRLSYSSQHKDDAYLIVLDREGVVRWLGHGAFEPPVADELEHVLTSLADRRQMASRLDSAGLRAQR